LQTSDIHCTSYLHYPLLPTASIRLRIRRRWTGEPSDPDEAYAQHPTLCSGLVHSTACHQCFLPFSPASRLVSLRHRCIFHHHPRAKLYFLHLERQQRGRYSTLLLYSPQYIGLGHPTPSRSCLRGISNHAIGAVLERLRWVHAGLGVHSISILTDSRGIWHREVSVQAIPTKR